MISKLNQTHTADSSHRYESVVNSQCFADRDSELTVGEGK